MNAHVHVDGHTVLEAMLHVPARGAWFADLRFAQAPQVSGQVTLHIGHLELVGTLVPGDNGTFAAARSARLVAGGAGWGTLVTPKHYHNDAFVKARTVAEDAARAAGERLGDFAPERARIGVDYVRAAKPAAQVLEDAIGRAHWWVGYEGLTHVGQREIADTDDGAYTVLDADPRTRVAHLAMDDLRTVGIGSRLDVGFEDKVTVRGLTVSVTPERERMRIWGGGGSQSRDRLGDALSAAVGGAGANKLYGKYRYRVVAARDGQADLQAVVRANGLPDLLPVSMQPGILGASGTLSQGGVVLVEFIEGDPTLPIITAYAPGGAPGHEADTLSFSVTSALHLGGPDAREGVPMGTSLKAWLDGHTHLAGTLVAPNGAVQGATGAPASASPDPSSKVKVA